MHISGIYVTEGGYGKGGCGGVSDLGSWVRVILVNRLVLMIVSLTGLDHCGRWEILRITAKLHSIQLGTWVEIRRLADLVVNLLLMAGLLLHTVETVCVDVCVVDGCAH